MTNFLFPCSAAADNAKKHTNYPALLRDIIRSASDSIKALTLFDQYVIKRKPASKTGLTAFDAHGGDSGCHLRASMIMDAYTGYAELACREPERLEEFCMSLATTIANLRELEASTRNMHAQLTLARTKPENLGLNRQEDTPRNILRQLGWTEAFQTNLAGVISETRSDKPNSNASGRPAEHQLSIPYCRAVKTNDGNSTLIRSNLVWDISDPSAMVRFIVYSYTLSRYRKFKFTGKRLLGLVDPHEVESRTKQLKCASMDTSCKHYKLPGINRLEKEFRDIKSWLSKFSNAWVMHTMRRLPRLHCMVS